MLEKLKTVNVFAIERVMFIGEKRKECREILSCWPTEYGAQNELAKIMEDQYGWNLLRYTIRSEADGGRVTVKENEDNGSYHVYTIKEVMLLVKDTDS